MRKTFAWLVVILVGISLLSCRERGAAASSAKGGATDTIAPAAAQPSPNGNDAMTQTVDVEDGRSESDGGVITNPPSTAKGAVAPRSAKAPATVAPAKRKKS